MKWIIKQLECPEGAVSTDHLIQMLFCFTSTTHRVEVLGHNHSHLVWSDRFRNDHSQVRRGTSGLCVNVDKNA